MGSKKTKKKSKPVQEVNEEDFLAGLSGLCVEKAEDIVEDTVADSSSLEDSVSGLEDILPELGNREEKRIKSLSDFRAEFDKDFIVPRKINAALRRLGKGWLYEVDFAKEAGVSLKDLYAYRDKYPDNIVHIPKANRRVWAGNVEVASQMREML